MTKFCLAASVASHMQPRWRAGEDVGRNLGVGKETEWGKRIGKLTANEVKAAIPTPKPGTYQDGDGLLLKVGPSGTTMTGAFFGGRLSRFGGGLIMIFVRRCSATSAACARMRSSSLRSG
jgi:hypothetical protein